MKEKKNIKSMKRKFPKEEFKKCKSFAFKKNIKMMKHPAIAFKERRLFHAERRKIPPLGKQRSNSKHRNRTKKIAIHHRKETAMARCARNFVEDSIRMRNSSIPRNLVAI